MGWPGGQVGLKERSSHDNDNNAYVHEQLEELNLVWKSTVFKSCEFGSPQKRERFYAFCCDPHLMGISREISPGCRAVAVLLIRQPSHRVLKARTFCSTSVIMLTFHAVRWRGHLYFPNTCASKQKISTYVHVCSIHLCNVY